MLNRLYSDHSQIIKSDLIDFIKCMLDTDLEDPRKADNAFEYIALDLFMVHCVNKDIDPDDFEAQEMEAKIFTDGILTRLIDFIDCKKDGLI